MNDFFGAIKSPDKYTDPGPSKDPAEGLGVLVYKLRVSLRRVTRPALNSWVGSRLAPALPISGKCSPTSFMKRSFIIMKSGTNARQRTNRPCTVHLRSLEFAVLETRFSAGMEVHYAGSEASFEGKAYDKSGAGFGRCRVDFFASGGRIGHSRADSGHSADTEHGTGSRNHAR